MLVVITLEHTAVSASGHGTHKSGFKLEEREVAKSKSEETILTLWVGKHAFSPVYIVESVIAHYGTIIDKRHSVVIVQMYCMVASKYKCHKTIPFVTLLLKQNTFWFPSNKCTTKLIQFYEMLEFRVSLTFTNCIERSIEDVKFSNMEI